MCHCCTQYVHVVLVAQVSGSGTSGGIGNAEIGDLLSPKAQHLAYIRVHVLPFPGKEIRAFFPGRRRSLQLRMICVPCGTSTHPHPPLPISLHGWCRWLWREGLSSDGWHGKVANGTTGGGTRWNVAREGTRNSFAAVPPLVPPPSLLLYGR